MGKLIIAFMLLITSPLALSQKVEQTFLGRALKASDRLIELTNKNGDSRGKNLTSQELCEWQLESAYLGFGDPKLSKILVKPAYTELLGKDARAYNFLLLDAETREIGFQMNYVFADKDNLIPVSTEIYVVKEGWTAKFLPEFKDQVVINSPSCTYWFKLNDPIDAKVEAN